MIRQATNTRLVRNKVKINIMLSKNKRLLIILSFVPLILLVPFLAMQFSAEVNWELLDFIVAGVILASAGIGIEIAIRNVQESKRRAILIFGVLFLVVLVWAELAVGIFGSPLAGS